MDKEGKNRGKGKRNELKTAELQTGLLNFERDYEAKYNE